MNIFDNLSEELKARLKACKTEEEMRGILSDADIELDRNFLETVVGGIEFPCEEFDWNCTSYLPGFIDDGNPCWGYSGSLQ